MNFPVELPPKALALAAELNVLPEDIDEFFVRGGGAGGQKINKTASCVELTHRPTETMVRVQRFREQHLNRIEAYKLLILKIEEKIKGAASQRQQEIFKVRKQKQRRSRRSKEKMLDQKHHRGNIKEQRQNALHDVLKEIGH
ncbi:MAG: peptide chain release factor-like protein [Candidatus Peribacteraceae bacterium]|nr:peptide chain release factor-like protein [Candidatus Peribacteraceae bacterium]MDD5075302.1 peptide chain release factor-like protein [Candidatus Peribacteraceae bacterium]